MAKDERVFHKRLGHDENRSMVRTPVDFDMESTYDAL